MTKLGPCKGPFEPIACGILQGCGLLQRSIAQNPKRLHRRRDEEIELIGECRIDVSRQEQVVNRRQVLDAGGSSPGNATTKPCSRKIRGIGCGYRERAGTWVCCKCVTAGRFQRALDVVRLFRRIKSPRVVALSRQSLLRVTGDVKSISLDWLRELDKGSPRLIVSRRLYGEATISALLKTAFSSSRILKNWASHANNAASTLSALSGGIVHSGATLPLRSQIPTRLMSSNEYGSIVANNQRNQHDNQAEERDKGVNHCL
ncbi:hypothetical protein [Ensifer sp. B1-9]|uniref:hypothetical protein n=1 Tax=Ensifer sp. B1-9 TaxID=3141455 RepID=UPI003D1A8D35